jgi:hypothetical protein
MMTHSPLENGPVGDGPDAQDGGNQKAYDQLVDEVNSVPIEVKKRIFKEALDTAETYGNAEDLVRHAVRGATFEVKKAAVGEAVEATPNRDAQLEVLGKGLKEAHSSTQVALAQAFGPSQPTLDYIWRWIVKTFAFVLGASTVGLLIVIALDAFTDGVEQTHVQIMLTAFTTVAGILAGFITGQALGKAQKD